MTITLRMMTVRGVAAPDHETDEATLDALLSALAESADVVQFEAVTRLYQCAGLVTYVGWRRRGELCGTSFEIERPSA